jgi:predicted nucleic acid-binding protein
MLAEEIAICDAVRMEVLAGARDEHHLDRLRRLLARATLVETKPSDYDTAASLYRICRRRGETVRKLIDCLIAAVAIREGMTLLHADADFEALARHTSLQIDTP